MHVAFRSLNSFVDRKGQLLIPWGTKQLHAGSKTYWAILVRTWKDKNVERNSDSRGLDHDISEDNMHSTGYFG